MTASAKCWISYTTENGHMRIFGHGASRRAALARGRAESGQPSLLLVRCSEQFLLAQLSSRENVCDAVYTDRCLRMSWEVA